LVLKTIFSMQRAINAEKQIENVTERLGITESGKCWMDSALDPFKDASIKPCGYPDLNSGNSVIQVVKQAIDIATVSGGSNWDCNIFLDQWLTATNVLSTTSGNNYLQLTGQGVTPYITGGVVVRQAVAGTPTYLPTATQSIGIGASYFANSSTRVIGCAMEIVNTTAEINLQGSVCAWRNPFLYEDPNVMSIVQDTTTPSVPMTYPRINGAVIPESVGNAVLLPGSKQWKAAKGAYIVFLLGTNENPAVGLLPNVPHLVSNGVSYAPLITSTGVAKVMSVGTQVLPSNFLSGGAYFTGLSSSTTLKLNVIYILERFPTYANTDLIALAYPSSPYDPMALELYSKIAKSLITGVPVDQNAMADWIAGIAAAANDALKMMAPYAGALLKTFNKRNGPEIPKTISSTGLMNPGQASVRDENELANLRNQVRLLKNAKKTQQGKSPKQGPLLPSGKMKKQR